MKRQSKYVILIAFAIILISIVSNMEYDCNGSESDIDKEVDTIEIDTLIVKDDNLIIKEQVTKRKGKSFDYVEFDTIKIDTLVKDSTLYIKKDSGRMDSPQVALESNKPHRLSTLVKAVGFIESRDNPKARNGCHVGYLQMSPDVVRDVNKYIKDKGGKAFYTLSDRYSIDKSIEMYYLFQEKYNPTFDMVKAIKIWRHGPNYKGNVSKGYLNAVKKKMKEYESKLK